MKKLLVLALLISNAQAATTGSLLLQGIILPTRSITVTAVSGVNTNLDLTTTQTDLKVATVNEKSNSILGYKVTITSLNLSKLKRSGGTEVFPYTLKYNEISAPVSTVAGYSVTYPAGLVNVNRDLDISYTGVSAETLVEGTYQDTLTLTISAP